MTPESIADLVRARWGVEPVDVRPVDGGMNSAVWRFEADGSALFLKGVVATDAGELRAGADTASLLSRAGMRTGAPRAALDGEPVVVADGRAWALLEDVAGRPLTASSSDQRLWGSALGRAHRLAPEGSDVDPLAWMPIVLDPTGQPPWLRDAVVDLAAELAALPRLTRVRLHTDPEREAFRVDERGDVGIIDWTGSRPGPALYDLASAVMYAGGIAHAVPLVAAYREAGPVPAAEIDAHLATFGRLRAVVQGLYFSARLARGDLTGIDDAEGNVRGLEDARGMVAEFARSATSPGPRRG